MIRPAKTLTWLLLIWSSCWRGNSGGPGKAGYSSHQNFVFSPRHTATATRHDAATIATPIRIIATAPTTSLTPQRAPTKTQPRNRVTSTAAVAPINFGSVFMEQDQDFFPRFSSKFLIWVSTLSHCQSRLSASFDFSYSKIMSFRKACLSA